MRYSKQRELILNAVINNPVHPTAEYIYELLKTDNEGLSLGTVYRNLNAMVENDMLKRISVPNGSDRYDAALSPHQHLICRKCGKVTDIYVSELEGIHNKILNKTGFDINCSTLAFEGLCSDCRSK